jgi:manganese/zinc/iron transport system permease protein
MALLDILLFQGGYNTTLVCIGAALLGAGGGPVGVLALLRRRALVSDAVSHATLPGICLGFVVGTLFVGEGKWLPILMAGAALSAALGVLAVEWIKHRTRLAEDTAIGTVLSTFYGLGLVLLSWIQNLPTGGQAGLETFLLGAVAGMLWNEAVLIGCAAAAVALITFLMQKEFGLVCFDPVYAAARGYPVRLLDLAMTALLVAIVVIGLQTVGLILIIAIVILPPAAARCWTDRFGRMLLVSAGIGALGCYLGAAISASAPRLPTGGIIVLVLAALFAASLLFAPNRGLVAAAARQVRFRKEVAERQALLAIAAGRPVPDRWGRLVLLRRGWVDGGGRPTRTGLEAASRARHDQLLWDRFFEDYPAEAFAFGGWSSRPIEAELPGDLVAELDRRVRAEAAA